MLLMWVLFLDGLYYTSEELYQHHNAGNSMPDANIAVPGSAGTDISVQSAGYRI